MVSSYQGHTLEWINNAYSASSTWPATRTASSWPASRSAGGVAQTGLVMATLVRDGDQWRMRAIGQGIAAKIPTESVAALRPFL